MAPRQRQRFDAGERILIKIATVAEKLPDDFKAGHSTIDWAGINRMRNLVAHHYDKVNDDLLWQALTVRIPDLIKRLVP
ncbi:MAG: HepT-like ribonuclease domain-containing protein [Propionicimonas sp.]